MLGYYQFRHFRVQPWPSRRRTISERSPRTATVRHGWSWPWPPCLGRHSFHAQTDDLSHIQAAETEGQVIAFWRAHGWPQVDATPKDGRTETTSSDHLPETLAWLAEVLESPGTEG